MKIVNICSNYGSYKDGIGAYSEKIVKELEKDSKFKIYTISTDITNFNKFQRITSLKMTKNFFSACKKINKEKIDIVNVEYPFTEWNPLIIIAYKKLQIECKKNNVKLVLSLHEYDRVNPLRKKIIKFMVKISDIVFVTEERNKKNLGNLNKNMYIRDIPSIIPITKDVDYNLKRDWKYVFFGLINKSKAFNEMIEGWRKFQSENKECELTIITSSKIDIENCQENNIKIKRNLPDKEIEDIMIESEYSILPIKPDIGFNNSTLKTSTLFSCVPIGKFNQELRDNYDFFVNMNEYTAQEFYKKLVLTRENLDVKNLQEESEKFGEKFNIKNVAQKIKDTYIKIYNDERE